ncbi:uncharacterized protein LOC106879106 [Octopus bimaculoides]|uniref:Suppressor of cytokine signaling 7 n=1 Tax=Octopus bimaculoides TaxID=37653 RepID=A0A0L8G5E3_OCTBM|nr:uncharacterized protein LOC106879106 [Octopus bimaculoides]|eukprot:XP_014784029.1 PREDICTED: uncharacterized protein LOC106879106 [Octopus bimaculoides]
MMKKITWKGFRLPNSGQQQRQKSGSTSTNSSVPSPSSTSNDISSSGYHGSVNHSQSLSRLHLDDSGQESEDMVFLPADGSCTELQQQHEGNCKKRQIRMTSKKLFSASLNSPYSQNMPTSSTVNSTSTESFCSSTLNSTLRNTNVISTMKSPEVTHSSSSNALSSNISSSVSSYSLSSPTYCPSNGGSSTSMQSQHYQIDMLQSHRHHSHHPYKEDNSLLIVPMVEQVGVPPKQRKEKKNLLRNLRRCFTPTLHRKVSGSHEHLPNNSSLTPAPAVSRKGVVSEHIKGCQPVTGGNTSGRKLTHKPLSLVRERLARGPSCNSSGATPNAGNSNADKNSSDCCNLQNSTLTKINEMHLYSASDGTIRDNCKTGNCKTKDISRFQKKLLEDYISGDSATTCTNPFRDSSSSRSTQQKSQTNSGVSENNTENRRLSMTCEQFAQALNERPSHIAWDRCPPTDRQDSETADKCNPYESCTDPPGSCSSLLPHYDAVRLDSPKIGSLTEELFRLSKFGWYWGPITRVEAEQKLLNQPDGAFLVRDSSDERYLLSLSFRSYGKTLHTRIEHCNGMFSFYAQPDTEGYPSIVDLIEHSMSDSEQKTRIICYYRYWLPGSPSFPVRLTKPVSRFTQVRSLQYLCRFVIRQYTRFDHIQQLPLPNSIKGWIEENQY